MAKKQARPGRTLIAFILGTAILYGLVALAGATSDSKESAWKPSLGLDLQGGTRITLLADPDKATPSADNLEEARSIIDQRVNGSGIAEAEVVTQGNNVILVEIPGDPRRDLVAVVQRQAQLRFRLVACSQTCSGGVEPTDPAAPGTDPGTDPGAEPSADPGAPQPSATETSPADAPTTEPTKKPSDGAGQGSNRAAPFAASGTGSGDAESTPAETTSPTSAPAETTTPAPSEEPAATPTDGADTDVSETATVPLEEAVAFQGGNYTTADVEAFNAYECNNEDGSISKVAGAPASLPDQPEDKPLEPLVACSPPSAISPDDDTQVSNKYLLSPSVISGSDLKDAGYGIPSGQLNYAVDLTLQGKGKDVFTAASSTLQHNVDQFAIVLDAAVISAPTFTSTIPDGSAQITGDFTENEAKDLATSLKFGSLPISFESQVETIGPSLAGDQLSAGLTAGAFGLGLVLIYCLLLLPRPRHRGRRLAADRGGRHLRPRAAAERDRGLHPHPARHRGVDHRGGHHGRLVHHLLRADT